MFPACEVERRVTEQRHGHLHHAVPRVLRRVRLPRARPSLHVRSLRGKGHHQALLLYYCNLLLLWQIGFKLLWGCLFFYPMFYGIGTWSLIAPPTATTDLSPSQVAAIVVLYLSGWFLTRGANNQKHALKTSPQRKTFGFMQQRTIEGTRILVSGL